MKQRRERPRRPIARLVAFLAATLVLCVGAQEPPATTPLPAMTAEGRPIATELAPDLLRLLDAARRLNEEPGLILDRKAIYTTLGVRPQGLRAFTTTEGGRSMGEKLVFEQPPGTPKLQGSLGYSRNPNGTTWSVEIKASYRDGPVCYPSPLVEAYWGKPFIYKPLGVHALMDELLRKQSGAPPTGPHDGEPYNAGFWALHATSANVSFSMGRGGCLSTISIGNRFITREYSDEDLYHE